MGNKENSVGFEKELNEERSVLTDADYVYGYLNIASYIEITPPGPIDPMIGPRKYTCPNCGTILAADAFWKDIGNGIQEPFCEECEKPLEELRFDTEGD